MVTDAKMPPTTSPQAGEKKPWRRTPLIESLKLSKEAGCLQPSGSFKSRGLGNFVLKAHLNSPDPSRTHFYCSSGGNAGLACVAAANFIGRPSTVVVPMTTKPYMIEKIKALGATDVLQHGAHFKEADRYLVEVVMAQARERGEEAVYCHPYDHPDVWQGHSSLVDEVEQQMSEAGEDAPEVLVCSVGGGGLFNGIMDGIARRGAKWDKTQVLALETQGAHSLANALEKKEWAALPGITSIANSLGAVRVSERTFELASEGQRTGRVKSVVLADAEAAMGCWRFAEDERILVEPACGVNVALCYGNRLKRALGRPVLPEDKVVIEVCGGSGTSTTMIDAWRDEYSSLNTASLSYHEDLKGKAYEFGATVRWVWVTLPAALTLLSVGLLFATIIETHRSEIAPWKGSLLRILLPELEEPVKEACQGQMNQYNGAEDTVGSWKVGLVEQPGRRWKVVRM